MEARFYDFSILRFCWLNFVQSRKLFSNGRLKVTQTHMVSTSLFVDCTLGRVEGARRTVWSSLHGNSLKKTNPRRLCYTPIFALNTRKTQVCCVFLVPSNDLELTLENSKPRTQTNSRRPFSMRVTRSSPSVAACALWRVDASLCSIF